MLISSLTAKCGKFPPVLSSTTRASLYVSRSESRSAGEMAHSSFVYTVT